MGEFSEFDKPVDFSEFDEAAAPAHVSTKPAAPFIPEKPPSFGEVAKGVGKEAAQPFVDAWNGLGAASGYALKNLKESVTHPIKTLAPENAGAKTRQVMRGVNSNIPFANAAVERIGGPPAVSEADRAAAPGAEEFGQVAGLPIGGAEGEIAKTAIPLVGRRLAKEAAASVARSAARGPSPIATVVEAGKAAAEEVGKHGARHGGAALAGQIIGGHTGAAVGAALSAAKPVGTAAAIALDEGAAAILRKLGMGKTAIEAAEKAAAPAVESAASAPSIPSGVHAEPEAPPAVAEHPQIAVLREALKSATPKQAEEINAMIEGYKSKAARQAASPAAAVEVPKTEQAPARAAEPLAAPGTLKDLAEASRPKPEFGGRPPNLATPEWKPGPADEKFARQLGMPIEKYRDVMTKRAERYGSAVDRMTKAARNVPDVDKFVKQASAAGMSALAARRVWEAAHGAQAGAAQ